jgi:hypothetical protein
LRTWVRKERAGNIDPEAFVLIPAGEPELEDFDKMRTGIDLRADVVAPRNGGLHRKAFALLKIVYPHTDYPTMDRLRSAMTIGAGFVEDTVDPYSGQVVWVPKSWSFEAMDNVEFEELYNRLVDVALQIVPGSKRDDWEQTVDQLVRM